MTSEAWTGVEPADDLPWVGEEPTFEEEDLDRSRLNGSSALDPRGFEGDVQEPAVPFEGLMHAAALDEDLAALPGGQLVDELVERGTVGTVAGIPETYKTWLAQAIAVGVARGQGDVLGQGVLEQGNVGYFWQDDSRRNELERIQTFARLRETPRDLPLRWFLNEGLRLPDDLERLRATIERYALVLAVLDSFYNVAGGIDLKDRGAGELVAALKSGVCDPTGCAMLLVDHAPWPTDSNRGQMRAYGDVHKGAAVRWGIYVQRDRGKLYVEARGNNIRGFKRTPAYWDEGSLELRLVDTASQAGELLEQVRERTLDWLSDHRGWHSTNAVKTAVTGEDKLVAESLFDLFENRLVALSVGVAGKPVEPVGAEQDADYRRQGLRRYWNTHNQAETQSALPLTPTHADLSAQPMPRDESAESARPRRGADSDADSLTGSDTEGRAAGSAGVELPTSEHDARAGSPA